MTGTTTVTPDGPPDDRPVARPLPLRGWLGVWIAAGLVVLTTLVAFLLGIVGDLESIDGSLAEASSAVGGAGGNVKHLPDYIAEVNTTLGAIDGALKPIPGATHDISGSLTGMRGDLDKVDGSLLSTSGSLTRTVGALSATSGSLTGTAEELVGTAPALVDTASVLKALLASLSDTSGLLANVRTVGAQILEALTHTQANPEGLGTENIWKRADATLTIRDAAEKDTAATVTAIMDLARHLKSICDRTPGLASC